MRWGQRRQDLIRVFTGSLWLLWEGDGGWSLRAEGNLRLIVKEEPQSTEGMGRGG